jgi:glutathione peroxidase
MKKLLGVLCLMTTAAFGASIHDFTMKTIDGKQLPLSTFKGKTVLVVNVASQCGFTPQYTALEAVYEKYKSKGLVIVGFPANNFGFQEPGTDEEIQKFCRSKYMVTFPMFSKISVKGSDKAPLYQYLTSTGGGEIQWNFTKFLVDKDGKVIRRFESAVTPDSPEVISAIEGALK